MNNIPSTTERSETFWETTPVPCLLLDAGGRVSSVNQAAARLYGFDPSLLRGRDMKELFSSPSDLRVRMRARRSDRIEEEVFGSLRAGDDDIPVTIRLQRLKTGKRALSYLAWINDEREVHELRRRLDRSEKLSAVAIVAGKVAHEIRTPLNSIFLNNDLLQGRVEKMRGAQGRKIRHYLDILQEEVERLDEVVRSYLSLARLAGSDRQLTAVEKFLGEFIDEVREDYARRNIEIATAFRARRKQLHLNRRQLRRVMLNLFSNSRDAMKNGGVITISTGIAGRGYRITVSDTGEGMPPEALSRLTTPFSSSKSNGSGLGLYLAREIVERHGGRLDIQSLQGEGTSVIVTLPCDTPPAS